LGPDGSKVTLTVTRQGESEPLKFVITRAKIVLHSAEGKMLDNGIAYVDINTFGEKTTQELRGTLDNLLKENPKGIIIDLRNNPGGYLNTAVEVASDLGAETRGMVDHLHRAGAGDEHGAKRNSLAGRTRHEQVDRLEPHDAIDQRAGVERGTHAEERPQDVRGARRHRVRRHDDDEVRAIGRAIPLEDRPRVGRLDRLHVEAGLVEEKSALHPADHLRNLFDSGR